MPPSETLSDQLLAVEALHELDHMQVGHTLNVGVATQVEVLLSLQHTLCVGSSSRRRHTGSAGQGAGLGAGSRSSMEAKSGLARPSQQEDVQGQVCEGLLGRIAMPVLVKQHALNVIVMCI